MHAMDEGLGSVICTMLNFCAELGAAPSEFLSFHSDPGLGGTPRRLLRGRVPFLSTVERLLLSIELGSAKAKLLGKVKADEKTNDEDDGKVDEAVEGGLGSSASDGRRVGLTVHCDHVGGRNGLEVEKLKANIGGRGAEMEKGEKDVE